MAPAPRIALTTLVAGAASVAAWAAPSAHADSAADVRTAVVAAAAYAESHGGSYAGMTVAALRRWVNVKNVKVVRAAQRSYCIQSISGRRVHFDGPNGKLRYGACGVRGAVVPAAHAPAPTSQPSWQARLKNAGIAALAYYTDHGSYAGMSPAALKSYDANVVGITVAWARADAFCIETREAVGTYHLRSADFAPTRGRCPSPPG
jgi:hypothetical protein